MGEYLLHAATHSEHWLYALEWEGTRPALLALIALGSWLLVRPRIRRVPFFLCLLVAIAASELLSLDAKPLVAVFGPQPLWMHRVTGIALVLGASAVVGVAVLARCLARRHRSVDRVMVGAALCCCAVLLSGYHLLLINGQMNAALALQEQSIEARLARMDGPDELDRVCASTRWHCESGPAGAPVLTDYPQSAVASHVRAHVAFYRARAGGRDFRFTDHKAFIHQRLALVYAYTEHEGQFYWVADIEHSSAIFNIAHIVYILVVNAVVAFWVSFAGLVILAHHFRFRGRQAQ